MNASKIGKFATSIWSDVWSKAKFAIWLFHQDVRASKHKTSLKQQKQSRNKQRAPRYTQESTKQKNNERFKG